MRITALIMGVIGGFLGMIVGFFGYGYTEFIDWFGEVPDVAEQVENVQRIKILSLLAPVLALAGCGMAISQPVIAGGLLLASAAGMYWGFEFGVFTMFPITLTAVAGLLALISGITRSQ